MVINIKNAPYAAVGEGIANDRSAWQMVADAVRANSGNCTIYVPQGN